MADNIAIVGAGLAGLVCGSILAKNGTKVTIFDKGRFPGGRLSSRDRDENTFDYGAQYFTARDSRFRTFLSSLMRNRKVARWNGRFANLVNGCLREESLSKPRYVGIPFMRSIAAELTSSMNCNMSHRVTGVSRHDGKWSLKGTIEDEPGQASFSYGDYDFLVLNMPPAQAEVLHPHSELSSIKMRPCIALLLAFDSRIELDFDGIKLDDKIISWVARDSSKPGRGPGERWIIHAAPDWSEENFQTNKDVIEKLLLERFATIFDITFMPTTFTKLHKWRFALPISPPNFGCIFDLNSALAYCGDWCVGARVEGAFLSGISAAEQISGSA
jgi:predicted NAD/FAD-dependent oxidoreductase